ncbi:MAG: hypothetical protein ABIJ00_09965, partial [Candidatus Eisenbacteria bacterium]
MLKSLFFYALAVVLLAGLTYADEEMLILRVEDPAEAEVLGSLGFHYLSRLPDAYLVSGDEQAVGRLAGSGISFTEITRTHPGEEVYLLKPRSFKDE